ncbi:MAG: response regulator [gamma proteobacterium symbiont of Taylorina sp.]|nr:response regulator [gamma proteobacterium symbiont of Taylorina sp.]
MNIKEQVYQSKILIVDDNPVNVSLLQQILNINGYVNIESSCDPTSVIPLYKKNHYDLILLDLNMPVMDGFAVMAQLSEYIKEDYLPVIVITAMTDHDVCTRSLSMGARDFINKPFDHMEVSHRIFNMLEVRVLYKQHYEQEKILEQKVKDRTMLLEESNLDMVRRLGQASEHRDNETGMHIIRMSIACEKLARAMGLDDQFAQNMLEASPLHDLGKIGIPDNVLLKKGKLNDDEWIIMKTHTTIGFDLLKNHASEIVALAQSIALNHHEKWDGSGYPGGLKGDEIPIEARIASICDVFDALTSARPYKKPWPVEDVTVFIKENSGSHFDPQITDIFIQIIPELVILRKQYSD